MKPVAKRLSDYQPPQFSVANLELTFELDPDLTTVVSEFELVKTDSGVQLVELNGEDIELISLQLDGKNHQSYQIKDGLLTFNVSEPVTLVKIKTSCNPKKNTSLEGLYFAQGAFCTQCEAEGFRKITYFLDRPDVLTTYKVKVIADKECYPYLLSNGNSIAKGDLQDGRHWVQWHDPFKKPSYLFALVAGDFDLVEDTYTRASGRPVSLQLFVDKGNAHRGQHALDSLKKAMAWDEEVFGLEYDLDIYMIVAVDFFNMGAMENKGLNVFNSKFVLADSASATDEDYFNIESIIAHEYFHNWTGNRVTCRDWFQLSLKEGLTVFRDQKFSEDMGSAVSTRIGQVKLIREKQFAEDAGPMSHPIRPESVIEMNNFYTVTVYDKGAEVIRMLHTLLGVKGFRRGMDLYFERHDGQAVTCDDFVSAMQDANDVDLTMFKRWYSQSGTPVVTAQEEFDQESGRYRLTLTQTHPATADQDANHKSCLHIPIAYELLERSSNGKSINQVKDDVATLLEPSLVMESANHESKPIPVLFKHFSAPVKVQHEAALSESIDIVLYANDEFARWDAAQTLYTSLIWELYDNGDLASDNQSMFDSYCDLLFDAQFSDLSLLAEILSFPSFELLAEQREQINVDLLLSAKQRLEARFAQQAKNNCLSRYERIETESYRFTSEQMAKRKLRNQCLYHLVSSGDCVDIAENQYLNADNMTDQLGALKALRNGGISRFDALMTHFEEKWRHDPLVIDKWFALHASTERDDILSILGLLEQHAQFEINNPNRVRALVGSFAFYNTAGFHHADGSGYRYVADHLIQLNAINPQVAARIITPMLSWRKYDEHRQDLLKHQLMRVGDNPELSKDLFEKISKSLKNV